MIELEAAELHCRVEIYKAQKRKLDLRKRFWMDKWEEVIMTYMEGEWELIHGVFSERS